jgi:hypothetical protein
MLAVAALAVNAMLLLTKQIACSEFYEGSEKLNQLSGSVIPACFKRESSLAPTWPPRYKFGADALKIILMV